MSNRNEEKTYDQVFNDVRDCLIRKGYVGIEYVDVFENSAEGSLELFIISDSFIDPCSLVIDKMPSEEKHCLQLDENKTLQLVYGNDVTGFECKEDTLIIEKQEENYEKN